MSSVQTHSLCRNTQSSYLSMNIEPVNIHHFWQWIKKTPAVDFNTRKQVQQQQSKTTALVPPLNLLKTHLQQREIHNQKRANGLSRFFLSWPLVMSKWTSDSQNSEVLNDQNEPLRETRGLAQKHIVLKESQGHIAGWELWTKYITFRKSNQLTQNSINYAHLVADNFD